jgi:hypothetical protein
MSSTPENIFVVPSEVFAQLDPIEKIVIKRQAERGELIIQESGSG